LGVLAQDLQKVLPDAVTVVGDVMLDFAIDESKSIAVDDPDPGEKI
jgi:hypothetical protein